ncbi:hypothetical protein KP509_29G076500 [Ceratopteris richardii]|uniref:Uncharacterized protein n=1 Tax=Ceratopteris richardii TaxID=49495 RepID=A0A8T2RAS6_CERRI|nr:hypothetical protein KP509_29G076500 [Ceratopteris richardii]
MECSTSVMTGGKRWWRRHGEANPHHAALEKRPSVVPRGPSCLTLHRAMSIHRHRDSRVSALTPETVSTSCCTTLMLAAAQPEVRYTLESRHILETSLLSMATDTKSPFDQCVLGSSQ